MTEKNLQELSKNIRCELVKMSHLAKTAHLGSALSCVDILVSCYWKCLQIDAKNPKAANRDRLIVSKGHAISALYATLAYRGFFDVKCLETYNQDGGNLPEQPSPDCVPGVEWATGSLGHGLSVGLGMALAAKIKKETHRVFVLLSDGECNEGSVWEAALFAPAKKLDNVVVLIDYNKWQATAPSRETLALDPLKEKWQAFGWDAHEVNGHDFEDLAKHAQKIPNGSGKPVAIIAHTIKGKGVSFMENNNNWHYKSPNAEELKKALEELQ